MKHFRFEQSVYNVKLKYASEAVVQRSCFATLLKSHFGMGVLLQICHGCSKSTSGRLLLILKNLSKGTFYKKKLWRKKKKALPVL